jgi:PAS domain S-box-containing protein
MTDTLPEKAVTFPIPAQETERLAALHRYKILDTPPEPEFDRITALAARLFDMPTVLISLVDETRAWFKSSINFPTPEVPRDTALCSLAVLIDEPLIVPDTRLDHRFDCNPFVQREPSLRFYAGAPLMSRDGFNMGTLCLIDSQPRPPLTPEQESTLVDLAAMVVDELELRLAAQQMARVEAALLEINRGIATATGSAFFEALVRHFAKVLDLDYAYLGTIEGDNLDRIRTIATYARGQIVSNIVYLLKGTPCWETIQQRRICCYPCNVPAKFPDAPVLQQLEVESYIAIPFFDSSGILIGVLGVMDRKPLENVELATSLLTIFAMRIATELQRQEAEIALRESEKKYRTLFESIDEGFCTIEVLFDENDLAIDFRYLETNLAFEQQTGLEGVSGRSVRQIIPDLEENWFKTYGNVALTGQSVRFENRVEAINRWFDVYAFRLDRSERDRVGVIFKDITHRKVAEAERERLLRQAQTAREEAENANRIKDEFLAVLSHELRSPLNPILGWSKLLLTKKLNEVKTEQALSAIERNAKLQSELIEDLLDVSRILRGKLNLNISAIDLTSTVKAAMETVRLAAEAKAIDLQFEVLDFASEQSSAPKFEVLGDATRLQQIVWNLLSNAVKFTPAGGRVEVRLEEIRSSEEDTHSRSLVQISVRDTGKGIATDFLPYAFDYFRQEDGATTRKFGGLGLGLAIVRHLVELHGGSVAVASEGEGLGATFTVQLPSSIAAASELNSVLDARSSLPDLTGVRVLVVDDDVDSREFITFVLEEAGAEVRSAASAGEAFALFSQSPPDVMLSDIGMPDLDGYMLMQQIKALPADRGGRVPAIALTAYAGDFNQQRALQAGFQQHLTKPVEPDILVQAIADLMRSGETRYIASVQE